MASPAIVSNALSSSGELNIINWDDELPNPVIPDFEKATGIKVNSTPFSQNEEQINKLQATGGEGFDVCQPTHDRALQFKDIDVLQPIDRQSSIPRASSCRACWRLQSNTGRGTASSITCRMSGARRRSPGATT